MGLHSHSVTGNQGRILIVDDEAHVRKPIRLILQAAQYTVVEAEDGEQAIQLLQSGDNPLSLTLFYVTSVCQRLMGLRPFSIFRPVSFRPCRDLDGLP